MDQITGVIAEMLMPIFPEASDFIRVCKVLAGKQESNVVRFVPGWHAIGERARVADPADRKSHLPVGILARGVGTLVQHASEHCIERITPCLSAWVFANNACYSWHGNPHSCAEWSREGSNFHVRSELRRSAY